MTKPLPPDDRPRENDAADSPGIDTPEPKMMPWPDGPRDPWPLEHAPAEGRVRWLGEDEDRDDRDYRHAQRKLSAMIIALAAASIAYRLLVAGGLQHGALVFIGIPALLAVIVAQAAPARTATGTIMRVTTLALLLSGVLFGEAFVCILFASPIFYLVAFIIGKVADWLADREKPGRLYVVVAFFIPLSLEGVVPGTGFPRDASVTVEREVAVSAAQVRTALERPLRFERELPPFLKLGFPTPGDASGEGLRPGDERRIVFHHGHHPGQLTVQVDAAVIGERAGDVRFVPVADNSYIIHWLSWTDSRVQWKEVAPNRTRIRWTLEYRRRLDPAWYFAPVERFGVHQAGVYLVETIGALAGAVPAN